jgi:hypothetical protein
METLTLNIECNCLFSQVGRYSDYGWHHRHVDQVPANGLAEQAPVPSTGIESWVDSHCWFLGLIVPAQFRICLVSACSQYDSFLCLNGKTVAVSGTRRGAEQARATNRPLYIRRKFLYQEAPVRRADGRTESPG